MSPQQPERAMILMVLAMLMLPGIDAIAKGLSGTISGTIKAGSKILLTIARYGFSRS